MHDAESKSVELQYAALTEGWGFVALRDWSTVVMRGTDCVEFLHNMCTNDLRSLEPGNGCEAFCTDVSGKIVAHLFVLIYPDRVELLAVPGQAKRIIEHLDRYVIREDVQLADETGQTVWVLVAGSQAAERLQSLFSGEMPVRARQWQLWSGELAQHCCEAVYAELTGPEDVLLKIDALKWPAVQSALKEAGATACDEEVYHVLRVESGRPLFGVDFDGSNLAQEAARDRQAISFTKGCYLGQETVARIDALGHVNKRLGSVKFVDREVPSQGAELRDAAGKPAGCVTSVCWSPRLKGPLALAMLRRGCNAPGDLLQSEFGAAEVLPTVTGND